MISHKNILFLSQKITRLS